jgi:hypothetical protein
MTPARLRLVNLVFGVASAAQAGSSVASAAQAGSTTVVNSQTSSLPANVAGPLGDIFHAYEQNPTSFSGSEFSNLVVISGNDVGIEVHDSNPAEFDTLIGGLTNSGMQVREADATHDLVVGLLPIAQLSVVATLSPTVSVNPQVVPSLR